MTLTFPCTALARENDLHNHNCEAQLLSKVSCSTLILPDDCGKDEALRATSGDIVGEMIDPHPLKVAISSRTLRTAAGRRRIRRAAAVLQGEIATRQLALGRNTGHLLLSLRCKAQQEKQV